ncbi:MAG: sigma-70 family RNA polymerase sigma factor [Armatimonadetes bacterium]|nr:MAG: sigma-70 family RNA polymerase sigma factor [Armatimonadota bacterium]
MDEAIYREHRDALVRYATVLTGPSNAEDIVSTVIARIYKSHRTLSSLDDPKPYLMKSVLNEAIDSRRRKQTLPLVDQAIEPREVRPDVFEAVIGLPVQQRAAVYLTYWIGMTSDEAATQMGCRPATVRRYLHLAKKKLEGVVDHV